MTRQDTSKPRNDYQPTRKKPLSQRPWLPVLLLLLSLFLPFLGELVQFIFIGEEQVCCMPDNYEWLAARAGIAKFLRPLSNLIIGGSMIGGIILVCYSIRLVYRQTLPSLTPSMRTPIMIVASLVAVYIIITLATMLLFFVFRNDYYYEYRPWPGGSLYDGAWFNPVHWLRATFANPFA